MRRIAFALAAWCAFAAAPARALPPSGTLTPEARTVLRKQLDLELSLERKKTQTLGDAVARRHTHLARRMRALYRLSQGGYLRLLLGADTPTLLFLRRDGLRRIVSRDLAELASVKRELAELQDERARLGERERDLAALDGSPPAPLRGSPFERDDGLYHPVAGGVVGKFGRYRDASGVELTRDGVELFAHPHEPVRAVAAGEVQAVEELPGFGRCVVLAHGNGWTSLTGRLESVAVSAGDRVHSGARLGDAAGPTVAVQIAQGGAYLDPGTWISR